MSLGLIGRKLGMTRIFTEDGASVPVTVVEVGDNRVTQIKTSETDGYSAVQIAGGDRKSKAAGRPKSKGVNKPMAGHFAKAGVLAGSKLTEFRLAEDQLGQYASGANVSVELFQVGQKVDVQGVSLGKGYAGTIKRYHFASGRASHGNSRSHNVPGSIGMAQDPGRVFPGKRMTGHLGDVTRTTQNLEVVRIDEARKLLLIKGAVPGSKGGQVIVRPAVKVSLKRGGV